MEKLNVFWDEKYPVGTISRNSKNKLVFQYSSNWLVYKNKPISLSLPCQEERFGQAVTTSFFENLLPESDVKIELAFNNRFDAKDTLAFLKYFGKDCAGAISILPADEEPDFSFGKYENINDQLAEILHLIKNDPENHRLYSSMSNARLSIAGAQDKLPVYIEGDDFFLPGNSGSPTSHIIKPSSVFFPDIQRNELFCMSLAKNIGINVPESSIVDFDGCEVFIVERYDRERKKGLLTRIHQEDFCQALGTPASLKYQEQGGPDFEDCHNLLERHLSGGLIKSRQALTEIMAFNLLIGNNDAHAKNFSILHTDVIKLSPFYDLVSSQVYPSLVRKSAMSIGDTYRNDNIKSNAFALFAKKMKLRPEKVFQILGQTLEKVEKSFESVLSDHEKQYGSSKIYSSLEEVLSRNIMFLKNITSEPSIKDEMHGNEDSGPRM